MDNDTYKQLATRYGPAVVTQWADRGSVAETMAIEGMRAITEGSGTRAAPDEVLVVMHYVSDHPEGSVFAVGAKDSGPLSTDDKRALVKRLLACLDESDPLQVTISDNTSQKKPSLIVLPGGER